MKSAIRIQRTEPDQVGDLLNRSSSYNRRVNYQLKNYKKIQTVQALNREKRKAASQPPEKPFKLSRFSNAHPLVFKTPQEVLAVRQQRRELSPPLRSEESRLDQVVEIHTPTRRNYLRDNAREVIYSPRRATPVKIREDVKTLNPNYGKVPKYLKRFHQETIAEQQRQAEAEEANKHPGLRLLSDDERITMMDAMVAEREATVMALNRVPLGVSSPTLLKKKQTLEVKLEGLDKSLDLFSRPKVYISHNL